MYFLGIDPGSSGAIAVIDSERNPVAYWDMPYANKELDYWKLSEILNEAKGISDKVQCVMELCQYTPAIKGSGAFTFGKTVGATEATLAFSGISYELVRPQKWKKEMSLLKADKSASIALAKKMFPDMAKDFLKTKDGRAEAFLIAEYCRRIFVKGN